MKELRKLHEAAAENLEKAADHHRAAANYANEKDYVTAAVEAHVAHGYSLLAHKHAGQAARAHVDVYPHHDVAPDEVDEELEES